MSFNRPLLYLSPSLFVTFFNKNISLFYSQFHYVVHFWNFFQVVLLFYPLKNRTTIVFLLSIFSYLCIIPILLFYPSALWPFFSHVLSDYLLLVENVAVVVVVVDVAAGRYTGRQRDCTDNKVYRGKRTLSAVFLQGGKIES